MSRLSRAARRTAAIAGLTGACLVPFLAPSAASATPLTPPASTVPATTVPAPKPPPTIASLLAPFAGGFDVDNNNFNVATHLVLQFPDLVAASTKAGAATIFLPTDYAFRRLVKSLTGTVVVPEDKLFATVMLLGRDRLGHILRSHVIKGSRISYGQLMAGNGRVLRTLDGSTVKVAVTSLPRRTVWLRDAAPALVDAKVIRANVPASNGVIHVIDQVMLPFVP
jgi:uncharacterized surface protein with fasciclin (FAS1) repeats